MHCQGCDAFLSDKEASRKTCSGEYLDLCDECYEFIMDAVPTNLNEEASDQVHGDFRK